jgi:hypothetical protein
VSATGESETRAGPAASALCGALEMNPMTDVTAKVAITAPKTLSRSARRDEPLARWAPSVAGR